MTSKNTTDKSLVLEMTDEFSKETAKLLNGMLDLNATLSGDSREIKKIEESNKIFISVLFTGIIYGEFILAIGDNTARDIAKVAGIASCNGAPNLTEAEALSPLTELLNIVSGQALAKLSHHYDKLTLTAPKIYVGSVNYPAFSSGYQIINTKLGQIECYFYLDTMQLDLAISYKEAMNSLIGTNQALHLANDALKRQQAQLVHSEKMASLGMMAAGVAHEINNPLAYVGSNISTLEEYSFAIQELLKTHELLLESLIRKDRSSLKSSFKEIRRIKEQNDLNRVLADTKDIFDETRSGIQKIKEIILGLKRFSHVDQGELKEVSINEEIENTLRLVSNQIKYKGHVIKDLGDLPRVQCYPGQLNQVFVNLLVNSAQALSETGGGEIRIITRKVDDKVEIRVADNGCGISSENIGKIFDPFFSTKPVGEGTGLGLSISYGIIQEHGGTISVKSEVNVGTEFTILLPIHQSGIKLSPHAVSA